MIAARDQKLRIQKVRKVDKSRIVFDSESMR